ncbi:MAG: hypothetical protein U1C49_02665 [Candidatus Andersenbacteria bacterium]|nr:hypothetical protein [bacterium]MDZ4225730.1 hypothetical protein [Candidatus Andersenbacteria bacterium]
MAQKERLMVAVVSPEGVAFEGRVMSVTAKNDTGPFDVLPGHASFISLIKDEVVIKEGNKSVKKIPIKSGIISCRRDKVDVYIGFE